MAKTLNQQQLEEIVKQCAEPTLANAGFKRRGSDFARLIEPGFIHLIEFNLGNPCPAIKESLLLIWLYTLKKRSPFCMTPWPRDDQLPRTAIYGIE
jgi:hypothetical protein